MNIVKAGRHRGCRPMRANDQIPALVHEDLARPPRPGPAREPAPAIQILNDWKLAFSQGKLAEAGVLLEKLRLLSLRPPRSRWAFEPPVNGNTRLD